MRSLTSYALQLCRLLGFLVLSLMAACAAAQAQTSPVSPTVCFEAQPQTFTYTLAGAVTAGGTGSFGLTQSVPYAVYRAVFNPGGATEETLLVEVNANNTANFRINSSQLPAAQAYLYSHAAGETVLFNVDGEAVFGYRNTSNAVVNIPRGVNAGNYFSPGPLTYTGHPTTFQPGLRSDVFRRKIIRAVPDITWHLGGSTANVTAPTLQACGTITYQGRLSDAGTPANGQYDLQFQAFDTETGGTAQSELLTLENVTVTNGVFTVPLKFGATLTSNYDFRFLAIGVRAGSATGNDPFTLLTPRQPLTPAPYAVNAQYASVADTATNATNATNADKLNNVAASQYVLTTDPRLSATNNTSFIQNTTTQQTGNFNLSGNGTLSGNLTVNGTLNATLPAGSDNYVQNGTTAQSANFNVNGNGVIGGSAAVGTFVSATETLRVVGATGVAGPNAGAGKGISLQGGNGGNASSGAGGAGAGLTLQGGNGGNANNGTGGMGGAGAGLTLQAGNGGFGASTGGAGAGLTLQAGNGGSSVSGVGGAGGSITLSPGAGQGHAPGASGNLLLAPANGNVGVGTNAPTAKLHVVGNTTLSGNLTVSGTLTGTATNATQLGGVAASDYLTNTSTFGQSVTTVRGTSGFVADATTGTYTLVPGLTQTVTVPANSSLSIATDGGIFSAGAVNTYSVIDVAIYVDDTAVLERRIVVSNFPLPQSVGNWSLSIGQTLTAGNHTIEVRTRTGISGGANATVSSGSDSLLRGQLTVTVVRK